MNLPPGVFTKGNEPDATTATSPASIQGNPSMIIQNPQPPATVGYQAASTMNDYDYTSSGEWILTMILYSIPVVNFIYLLITILKDGNTDKKNWAKAALIVLCISYVIFIVACIILGKMSISQLFDSYIQYQNV